MKATKPKRYVTTGLKFPLSRQSSAHPINESSNICSTVHCNVSNLQLLLLLCTVFVVYFTDHSFGETSKPLNRRATKGERVQLNCSTLESENGLWKYKKPLESNWRRIYDGDNVGIDMKSLFYVNDSETGCFNLIFNASESTSGTYTCQPAIHLTDQSAEIIVFDTLPQCSMTMTSGIANASCRIHFSGNWAPRIVWHNATERIETNETITIPNHSVTSFLIAPLNQIGVLTCTLMFALEDKPHYTTATNVPDLPTNCTLTIGTSTDISWTQSTTDTAATAPPPSQPLYTIGLIGIVFACILIPGLIIVFLYKHKAILWAKCTRSSTKNGLSEAVPMAKAV